MARDTLIKECVHNDLSQNREQVFWTAFQTSRGPASLAVWGGSAVWIASFLIAFPMQACCGQPHYSRVQLTIKAGCIYLSEQIKVSVLSKDTKLCILLSGLHPSLPCFFQSMTTFLLVSGRQASASASASESWRGSKNVFFTASLDYCKTNISNFSCSLYSVYRYWIQQPDFYFSGVTIEKPLYVCGPRLLTWF